MKSLFRRRTFMKVFAKGSLGLMVSSIAAACVPGKVNPLNKTASDEPHNTLAELGNNVFQHGVASGDPDADSVVLWTRVTTALSAAKVDWEIASDRDFSKVHASGSIAISEQQDFTAKVIATGLQSGRYYFFRFGFGGVYSQVGRTKTMPRGDISKYTIALASCSNFPFGYFNPYDAMAKDSEIDLVLHTGDYIYEYPHEAWGKDIAEKLNRVHEPLYETITLADYRARHAQYKTDRGSQAMHAAHPFICCWDDHESANNPWAGGASNHQSKTEGSWQARRAASIQAYYEWMPIRDPQESEARKNFTRNYQIGNLGDIVTLESRHTARGEQVNYADYYDKILSKEDADRFKADVIDSPDRKMISDENQQLVKQTFKESVDKSRPWRLLGSASPIARMLLPDIESLGVTKGEAPEQLASDTAKSLFWKGKYNLPFYTDTWDGYPWAREQFYSSCKEVGAQDLIFLSGDSHSFWLNKLSDANNQPMGIELGTAGITSPSDFVHGGWKPEIGRKLDLTLSEQLDEVIWTDSFHQGFVKLELGKQQAKTSFIAVNTLLSEDYSSSVIKSININKEGKMLTMS